MAKVTRYDFLAPDLIIRTWGRSPSKVAALLIEPERPSTSKPWPELEKGFPTTPGSHRKPNLIRNQNQKRNLNIHHTVSGARSCPLGLFTKPRLQTLDFPLNIHPDLVYFVTTGLDKYSQYYYQHPPSLAPMRCASILDLLGVGHRVRFPAGPTGSVLRLSCLEFAYRFLPSPSIGLIRRCRSTSAIIDEVAHNSCLNSSPRASK